MKLFASKTVSEETRRKQSLSAMGHPNRNIELKGCFKKGQPSWNKGKKYQIGQGKYVRTYAVIEKMSASLKGRKAWNKGISGTKSHTWKGGRSGLTERIRTSSEYKQWRADVFFRDGWTCQTCGLRGHGKDIESHHIVPINELLKKVHIKDISVDDKYILAMSVPEMFDVNNGVTLCKQCHINLHKGEKQ